MIYFIGAGPGAPDLITVRGLNLLKTADVVIYAGSLVNPEILKVCKEGAELFDSAKMTLEEVTKKFLEAEEKNLLTVRLHSGDPSIYGTIREQADFLSAHGINFEVVPGLSSFLAAAASLKTELTLPNVTQSVIITRFAGRTPAPERESLKNLAKHQTTLCIFLSIQMISEVAEDLKAAGLSEKIPVVVIFHASRQDEKIIRGTLADIVEKVLQENISRTALILVGEVFNQNANYTESKLYASDFSHMFREKKS